MLCFFQRNKSSSLTKTVLCWAIPKKHLRVQFFTTCAVGGGRPGYVLGNFQTSYAKACKYPVSIITNLKSGKTIKRTNKNNFARKKHNRASNWSETCFVVSPIFTYKFRLKANVMLSKSAANDISQKENVDYKSSKRVDLCLTSVILYDVTQFLILSSLPCYPFSNENHGLSSHPIK